MTNANPLIAIENGTPPYRNKLEARYGQRLELLKRAGEIVDFEYEGIKLKLAPKTFLTLDFMVITDTLEFHETKGFMREDANVKLKVAAAKFPWFRFKLVREVKKQWQIVEI